MSKKLTEEQKAENKRISGEKRAEAKKEREAKKEAEKIQRMKDQPRVTRIEIMIEWKKSATWGANPHLTAKIWGEDRFIGNYKTTCSGCGYDKESTVMADVFNNFLRYKLFLIKPDTKRFSDRKGLPYGIHLQNPETGWAPYYDGGIGMECYRSYDRSNSIADFIGGTLKRTASSKTANAYEYIDNGTIK